MPVCHYKLVTGNVHEDILSCYFKFFQLCTIQIKGQQLNRIKKSWETSIFQETCMALLYVRHTFASLQIPLYEYQN